MKLRSLLLLAILAGLSACRDGIGPDPAPPIRDYREGGEYAFNVQAGEGKLCTEADRDLRTGRVVSISERAIIVADVNNPPGGFTDEEYRGFGRTIDELVWPVSVANFGEPFDIDENQRVVVFFTRAVNELTPRGQSWYVGGFFTARDLFPPQPTRRLDACPGSNFAEMLYMLVPDPQGVVNENPRRKDGELRATVAVLGHEFQHLINASRRLYSGRPLGSGWNEEVWLNEGLSHIAEELLGFAASDLEPRRNITADDVVATAERQNMFSLFMYSNFDRLRRYMENPDTAALIGPDRLATRGAAYQFLRFAADRKGGSEAAFWRSLVDTQESGLVNLRSSLGGEPMEWIQDWTVALAAADAVPNLGARFQQPSWDLRSIYPRLIVGGQPLGRYPLRFRGLGAAGESLSLAAGSAAFLRFRVDPGTRAEIRTSTAAASCLPGGAVRDLAVGEVVSLTASEVAVVCLSGGLGGRDFIYIPFNAGTAGSRLVNVSASGVSALSSLDVSAHQQGATIGTRAMAPGADMPAEESWKLRLRERELRELTPRVPGAGPAPSHLPAGIAFQTAADDLLRVSIVRIR